MPQGAEAEGHLTEEGLARLVAGELSPAERMHLLRHLLRGCQPCRAQLAPLVMPPQELLPEAEGDLYDLPMARAIAAARAAAADAARRQEPAASGPAEAPPRTGRMGVLAALVTTDRDDSPAAHRDWCELILETAVDWRAVDPLEALDLAEMAVVLAEDLTGRLNPDFALSDLQARAWMEMGNIHRILGNLTPAQKAFARVRQLLLGGTEDVLLGARLLDFEGSLFRAQRHFPEALEVLDLAARLYLRSGERHLAGRTLLNQATVFILAVEPQKALQAIDQALGQIDLQREPALVLALVHNCLLALVDSDEPDAADRLLWRARWAYQDFGTVIDRVKLLGLEGRIARDHGQLQRAERYFREAKAGFEREKLPYDAALISLDLSEVLIAQGKPAEVLPLVDRMLDTFKELNIDREAVAAGLLLRKAVLQGELTVTLVRGLERRLRSLAPQGPARPPQADAGD